MSLNEVTASVTGGDDNNEAIAVMEATRARLVSSGEYDKLMRVMRDALHESGWTNDLIAHLHQHTAAAQQQQPEAGFNSVKVHELLPIAEAKGLELLTDDVRQELMAHIKRSVNNISK